MQKNKRFLAVIAVLFALIIVLPVSIYAATKTENGITVSYPDGPNCIIGQDKVTISVDPAPAGGVRFDFFGGIDDVGIEYITTIIVATPPFEVVVPYDSQYPITAVFAALLDAQGEPIQGQKISAKWRCTFEKPTATPTKEPPTPTPTNTPTPEPPTPTPTYTSTPVTPTPTPTYTPTPKSPAQGCTPGYWKQPQHLDSWPSGYAPGDRYNDVFGVTSSFAANFTLLEALGQGGGGERALARHAVAALLNAAHPSVNYLYPTEADVISMVQAAYGSGDFETTKNLFDTANNTGTCPLN